MSKYKVSLSVELEFEVEGDFDFENNYPWHEWEKFLNKENVVEIIVLKEEEE